MSSKSDDRFYKKVTAYSGIAFATFLFTHLLNHSMAIFSMDIHTSYLNVARKFYRNPLVEVVLVACLGIHVLCALRTIYMRPRVVPKWLDPSGTIYRFGGFFLSFIPKLIPWTLDTSAKAHRIIGYFLVLITMGHVLFFRVLPQLIWGYDKMDIVDGRIVTAAIAGKAPMFIPYTFILFVGGFYHAAYGSYLAYQRLVVQKPVNNSGWLTIVMVVMVIAAATTAGYGGFLYKIDIPWDDFRPLLEKMHVPIPK